MEAQDGGSKVTCFSDLVDDVLHLICAILYDTSPTSLTTLARASRSLNAIAMPFIFRNVRLRYRVGGVEATQGYYSLVRRLEDETSQSIAKHVRHIHVYDFESTESLERIVKNCRNLQELSWHSRLSMPMAILKTLQANRPEAEISVYNYAAERGVYDKSLLSCPQLVSLEYILSESKFVDLEIQNLLDMLQVGAHCRALTIDTRQSKTAQSVSRDFDQRTPSLQFLEDVTFTTPYDRGYNPSRLVCALMKKSKLRKLSVPFWSYSFPVSNDRFQNLRYLHADISTCDPHEISSLGFFLRSEKLKLHGLSLVDTGPLADRGVRGDQWLWQSLTTHKSLKELMLPFLPGCGIQTKTISQLEAISESFKDLERLGTHIPLDALEDICSLEDEAKRLTNVYISRLAKMNLKVLDLHVSFPNETDSIYTLRTTKTVDGFYTYDLNVDRTLKTAYSIANSISNSQLRPLETITLHLYSIGTYRSSTREAKVQLRSLKRDDGNAEGMRNYQVIKRCDWRITGTWDPEDLRVFELPDYHLA